MGIAIDANMYLLCSLFNISYRKVSTVYSGMTIEEIMEKEAEQGNVQAENFDKTVLNDPVKLIELMQLKDPGNKYAIMSHMNEYDLDNMLPLLQQQDLILGLNYFTQEKLLQLFKGLPIEQLVKTTLNMFSVEQVMLMMPDDAINKVLQSPEMKDMRGLETEMLKGLKPEILAQMIEATTGEPAQGVKDGGLDGKPRFDKQAMINQLMAMDDKKFQESLINMPPVNKQFYMLSMVKEKPEIMCMFEPEVYTNMMANKKEKKDMIKAATAIENEQLQKMIKELPKELTAVVLTQIDTNKFADILMNNFKDVLKQIVAA